MTINRDQLGRCTTLPACPTYCSGPPDTGALLILSSPAGLFQNPSCSPISPSPPGSSHMLFQLPGMFFPPLIAELTPS